MTKALIGAFVAIAFMFGITIYNAPPEPVVVVPPSLQEQVLNATVRVEVSKGGRKNNGSGTVLDNVHILTNHHVVSAARADWSVQVRGWIRENDKVYPVIYDATIVAADEEIDLALLRIDGYWAGSTAWISSKDPPETSEVCKSGSVLGKRPRVTCGIWAGYDSSNKIGDHVTHSAATGPGDSGGGIWANIGGRYQVVAVTKMVPNLGPGGLMTTMGMGIPLAVVQEFITESMAAVARGELYEYPEPIKPAKPSVTPVEPPTDSEQ